MKPVPSRSASRASRFLPVVLAVALGSGVMAAGANAGAITGQSVLVTANPAGQSATLRGPASLTVSTDATYAGSAPFTPALSEAVISLDQDFLIDPSGVPQCTPASIAGTTTAQALANCPKKSRIGSGSATIIGPSSQPAAVGTVFNGTTSGGQPRILIHLRFEPAGVTVVLYAVVSDSPLPGFGQQLHFVVPPLPGGFVVSHLDFGIDQIQPSPGSAYFSARCSITGGHAWNYNGAFTYNDLSTRSDSGAEICDAVPTLTIAIRGHGAGRITGPGINCPGDCAQAYPFDSSVALTATHPRGSRFAGWGGACSGKAACDLAMSQNRAVTATFKRICRRPKGGAAVARRGKCHLKRCHHKSRKCHRGGHK